jgi:hypothetical protein
MFERAVRNSLSVNLSGIGTVSSSALAPYVFLDLIGRYPANTDVVMKLGAALWIADAKYKERAAREWPTADEVQEVLTHAQAYRAQKALLIYPGSIYWARRVGEARSKCELWCFGVRLNFIVEDIKQLVEELLASTYPTKTPPLTTEPQQSGPSQGPDSVPLPVPPGDEAVLLNSGAPPT